MLIISHLYRVSSVTNFNNGLEASSDSDDEDKLHIVEEDSLQEPEAAAADGAPLQDSHDAAATVLPHNGLNGGRRRCRVRNFVPRGAEAGSTFEHNPSLVSWDIFSTAGT